MIMFRLSISLLVLFLLIACGNLKWPLESGGVGYSSNGLELVKSAKSGKQGNANKTPQNHIHRPIVNRPSAATKQHIVVAGETLWRIAQAYNTDIYELAIVNKIEPPFLIFAGQRLAFPNYSETPVKLAAFKKTYQNNKVEIVKPIRSGIRSVQEATALAPLTINEPVSLAVKPGTKPQPNRRTAALSNLITKSRRTIKRGLKTALPPVGKGSEFIWPVKGKLVSGFGRKSDGLYNDGVNIVAARGTVVRAAGSGIVAYAGNELRGFGNLLLIKHGDGWVTAYAHNERLVVRRGEKVRQGQVIARVGATGNVVHPQLHFEIRRGNKAVDPIRKISRLTRQPRAKHAGISQG